MENWKSIPNYEGLYEASDLGRIRSVDRYVQQHKKFRQLKKSKVLSPAIDRLGYVNVALSKLNKLSSYKVHRLVALCHVPNENSLKEINHKDGNKQNNRADNLEWCTREHNIRHAVRLGLLKHKSGQDHHNAKLSHTQAQEVKILYYDNGFSVSKIKRMYGVNMHVIYKILKISRHIEKWRTETNHFNKKKKA